MAGRLNWGRACLAMHRQTYSASQTDEIMSKYRPIAPKPTLHMTSNLCKSASNSDSALEFRSTFTTTRKGNNNCKGGNGGRNRSGRRKRASDHCSKSPSPRVLKKARGSNIAIDDQRSTHIIDGPTIPADGPTILYNFQGSFIAEKSKFEKPELEAMERTAANGSEGRSVLNKSYGGFEGVNKKAAMKSIGELGIENPATQMAETQFGFGSANYFVFPIVSEIQQEEETNLVTLPLLPETPSLQKDLVLGSSASNSTSIDHKPNTRNASCDKEVIPLRLFGKDLSHKEVAASHLSSNESPKRRNFVPIVGLSFL